MQFDTVIFDMDGLLIDSEPLWNEAANRVFGRYGIRPGEADYSLTTGLRTKEFVRYWFRHFGKTEEDLESVTDSIVEVVTGLITGSARPLQGVNYIFEFFRSRGFKIGIASSSPEQLIHTVTVMLGIADNLQAVCSAENLDFGKPHPRVYLNCAKLLGSRPNQCICFEDSFNGLTAAKAAGMKCVVVPVHQEYDEPKWGTADLKLRSLSDFNETFLAAI